MGEFDSILIRVEIGASRKLRRLTPEERWCAVAGVWCLAAKSPLRGYLLVAEKVPVDVDDIAEQAGVKRSVAQSTLKKMHELGMLEVDEELDSEHVHDWHVHQPEPKASESRAAWRERKRRQRESKASGHGDVPPTVPRDGPTIVTPRREENGRKEKRQPPPTPPTGGRRRDQEEYDQELTAWVEREFPHLPLRTAVGLVQHAVSAGNTSYAEVRDYVLRWAPAPAESVA